MASRRTVIAREVSIQESQRIINAVKAETGLNSYGTESVFDFNRDKKINVFFDIPKGMKDQVMAAAARRIN